MPAQTADEEKALPSSHQPHDSPALPPRPPRAILIHILQSDTIYHLLWILTLTIGTHILWCSADGWWVTREDFHRDLDLWHAVYEGACACLVFELGLVLALGAARHIYDVAMGEVDEVGDWRRPRESKFVRWLTVVLAWLDILFSCVYIYMQYVDFEMYEYRRRTAGPGYGGLVRSGVLAAPQLDPQ